MIYEDKKVIAITKPLKEYKKKYIICVLSSQFWVIYDETNNIAYALSTVGNLESRDEECIIIRNAKRKD